MISKRGTWIWMASLALILTMSLTSLALAQGSVTFGRQVIGAGGASASNGDIRIASTLGQPLAGAGSTGSTAMLHGFWSSANWFQVYLPVVVRNYFAVAPPCIQANGWCEPNNASAQAYGPLASGTSYSAYQEDADDYYYITLLNPGSIHVTLTAYEPKGYLYLYTEGLLALSQDNNTTSDKTTLSVSKDVLSPGIYYIRIYTYEGYRHNRDFYTLVAVY